MTEMENPKKRLKVDYESRTIEDLPLEIQLKIFNSVNIRGLFQCMAVNKKIRKIANDQSLWNKMHIDGDHFEQNLPAELLSQILEKVQILCISRPVSTYINTHVGIGKAMPHQILSSQLPVV